MILGMPDKRLPDPGASCTALSQSDFAAVVFSTEFGHALESSSDLGSAIHGSDPTFGIFVCEAVDPHQVGAQLRVG